MKNDQTRKEGEDCACVSAPSKSKQLPFCSCSQSQLSLDKLGGESKRWLALQTCVSHQCCEGQQEKMYLPSEKQCCPWRVILPEWLTRLQTFSSNAKSQRRDAFSRHSLWAFSWLEIKEKYVRHRVQEQSIKHDSNRLLIAIATLEILRKDQIVRI